MGETFRVGDRVVRNPATWRPNEFDSWGRGVGVGVVVDPPFPLEAGDLDIRWPGGRCFETDEQLLRAPTSAPSPEIEADPESSESPASDGPSRWAIPGGAAMFGG